MARLRPEGVDNLGNNIRKPGGMTRGGERIPYFGIEYLKQICSLMRHFKRISRTPDLYADFTHESLEEWDIQASKEKEWPHMVGDTTYYPKLVKVLDDDPHHAFKLLDVKLESLRSPNGVLLSVMTREKLIVPDEADDDRANYDSADKEMIAR